MAEPQKSKTRKSKPDYTLAVESPRVMPTDLDELQWLARYWGAGDSSAIETGQVLLDPRVRFKCMIPKCYMSGACEHCPPLGKSIEEVRETVDSHDWAILFRVRVKPSIIAAKGLGDCVTEGVMDSSGNLLNLGAHYMLVFSIARLLQKTARQMGYRTDAAFAAGNCRDALCHFRPDCKKLSTGVCRHPGLSLPSMESAGMDAFTMGARQGWNVFPIGGSCEPKSVKTGSLMGLVLLAPGNGPFGQPMAGPARTSRDKGAARSGGLQEKFLASVKELRHTLAAQRQDNVTLMQLPNLIREGGLWMRLFQNLTELEGSRSRAAAQIKEILSGRPRKRPKKK